MAQTYRATARYDLRPFFALYQSKTEPTPPSSGQRPLGGEWVLRSIKSSLGKFHKIDILEIFYTLEKCSFMNTKYKQKINSKNLQKIILELGIHVLRFMHFFRLKQAQILVFYRFLESYVILATSSVKRALN